MNDSDSKKFLNHLKMLNGFVNNEKSQGKSDSDIIKTLVNDMNIDEELANKIVLKSDNYEKRMEIFTKEYIRKSLFIYTITSIIIYSLFVYSLSFIQYYEDYLIFLKYLLILLLSSFIVFGATTEEKFKSFFYYINIISILTISISSFLLSGLSFFYLDWEKFQTAENIGNVKANIIVSIFNSIINLGPNIIGTIMIIISIIFIMIAWDFFYKHKTSTQLNQS